MVLTLSSAQQVGGRTDWFPASALDASGEVVVTLTHTPSAGTRVVAFVAQSRRTAHVVNVSGRSVTLRVVRERSPALAHNAPAFTGTPMGTHTHAPTTDPDVMKATGNLSLGNNGNSGGVCIVGCSAADHPASAPEYVKATAGLGKVAAMTAIAAASAGTPAGAVAAPATHAETDVPVAASENVDLAVTYEV